MFNDTVTFMHAHKIGVNWERGGHRAQHRRHKGVQVEIREKPAGPDTPLGTLALFVFILILTVARQGCFKLHRISPQHFSRTFVSLLITSSLQQFKA